MGGYPRLRYSTMCVISHTTQQACCIKAETTKYRGRDNRGSLAPPRAAIGDSSSQEPKGSALRPRRQPLADAEHKKTYVRK